MNPNIENAWVNWINKEGKNLTLHNYEDETLSFCSFKAGAEYMRQKAGVNFELSLRKLKSHLLKEACQCFSLAEEMIKFNRNLK